jgi:hypothetical protein
MRTEAASPLGAAPRPAPASARRPHPIVRGSRRMAESTHGGAGQPEAYDAEIVAAHELFEAHAWGKAIVALRRIALERSDHPGAAAAAVRYLAALETVGSSAPDAAAPCYREMERDAQRLVELHCDGAAERDNLQECRALWRVVLDVHRYRAEKLVELADRSEHLRQGQYARAGEALLQLLRSCSSAALRLDLPPLSWRCDEIGFSAARSFLAARRAERAAEALAELTRPEARMSASPLVKRLQAELAPRRDSDPIGR